MRNFNIPNLRFKGLRNLDAKRFFSRFPRHLRNFQNFIPSNETRSDHRPVAARNAIRSNDVTTTNKKETNRRKECNRCEERLFSINVYFEKERTEIVGYGLGWVVDLFEIGKRRTSCHDGTRHSICQIEDASKEKSSFGITMMQMMCLARSAIARSIYYIKIVSISTAHTHTHRESKR